MNSPTCFWRWLCALGVGVAAGGLLLAAAEDQPRVDLDALVADVVANNPELAFYEAEIEATRAGARTAGTRDDPELGVDLGRKRVTEPGGVLAGEGTAWSVSVSQVFEWPGRLSLRKAIANRDVMLAELGLDRFKAALEARARTLAYGLHAAHERAAAFAEVANRYQALREVFLARDPAGVTPLLETRVIEAQELALQHAATEAQLAAQAALIELNQLRGQPADTPVHVSAVELKLNAAPDLATILAAAYENNFEFQAARVELEQQGLVLSLVRNERRPSVTVSPFYSEASAGETEQTYGIGFSVPLPVTGRASANVAAAEARRRQAEAAVGVAQRDMERAVLNAAHTFAARLTEVRKWSPDATTRFREAAELADRHYRLGAVPIGTYVELQNSYLEAVDVLYETQLEALEAGTTLQLLTGLDFHAVRTEP